MAGGSSRPIEQVKPGDKVIVTDARTGETRVETVTAAILGEGVKNLVRVSVDTDGESGTETSDIVATDGHPFWVPELSKWLKAADLAAGQWLQTGPGTYIQITAVHRWSTSKATVHNLTVSNIHTYYVLAGIRPVLVHNCGDQEVAEEVHAAFSTGNADSDAYTRNRNLTVGVMTTAEGRFAAQAGRAFTEEQVAILAKYDITPLPFPGPQVHAERQLLNAARDGDLFNPGPLTPISMGTSRDICPRRCQPMLLGAGWDLTGKRSAVKK